MGCFTQQNALVCKNLPLRAACEREPDSYDGSLPGAFRARRDGPAVRLNYLAADEQAKPDPA